MKKILSICLVFILTMTLLTGCAFKTLLDKISPPEEKTFTKSGMSITLTDDFYEKEYVSFTSAYESEKIAVFTLKEEFTLFGGANYSLKEYAELVTQANMLSATVKTKDDLTYFAYDKEVNGKDFHYTAFVYKGSDAYWLIQFACVKDQAEKLEKDIFAYAASVKV